MSVTEKIINMRKAFENTFGVTAVDMQFRYSQVCEKDANISIRIPFVGRQNYYVKFKTRTNKIKSIELLEDDEDWK